MPLTSDTLRSGEARRIALHAQGFSDPRPTGRVDRRHFRRVMGRLGLVQIDSVNVLTRSHELPFLARLGPYDRAALSAWLWGSGEVFEYWGHEASLLPVDDHRLFRWRMAERHAWTGVASWMKTHPGLGDALLEAVRERGPVSLGQLSHLGDAVKRAPAQPGQMWNWTPAKRAVEWFFWQGVVSAVRNPQTFERSYVMPERVLPATVLDAPTPSADDAMKALLLRAARSHGVGTAKDLADYHRLPIVPARRLVAELAADGELRPDRGGGLEAPGLPPPRGEAASAGPRRRAALAVRPGGVGANAHRVAVRLPLPHRDLRTGRAARARLLRAPVPPRQPPRRPRRPQGRPPVEPTPGARRLRRTDVGRRQGPRSRWSSASTEMAAFLGLDEVVVERRGDLAGRSAR